MTVETSLAAGDFQCASTKGLKRVNDWKASVMQSVLLFSSFALLTFGVACEAATPSGASNGLWAVGIIVPAAGFLLSLANWYFVRLYPSRRAFCAGSLLATLLVTVCGYVWAMLHYRSDWSAATGAQTMWFAVMGGVLSIIFCALSGLLSRKYAQMIGKE